jgi:hypothetical protein
MKKKSAVSRISYCILIALAACSFKTMKGASSDTASFTPKLYVNAGLYFPESTTTFQVNGTNGLGTLIFVEQFLHVDRSPLVFTANLLYKITRRSIVSARFFNYNVKGNFEVSENNIQIRDTMISLGANLKTKWTNNYFGLNYNYAIFSKPKWSSGLSFGMRMSMIKIKLDYDVQNKTGEYASSLAIPIVLWGLFAEGYMAPKLRGSYSFEMFKLSVNGISGLVYENRFGLEYYFLKNLGVGFSYNQILYKINEIPFNDRFDGDISYSLSGMQLNLHARF